MTKQEQDKLWAELSEESKERIRCNYNTLQIGLSSGLLEDENFAEQVGRIKELECMFGEHNLKPALTYEDVAKELGTGDFKEFNNKLEAIGKLMVVAKFLNKNEDGSDWVLNWKKITEYEDEIAGIGMDRIYNEVRVFPVNPDRISTEPVYFRTEELAQQAVQILGKDVVMAALTTKY